MAGIANLTEIYKKKGRDFLDKLFDGFVTINEKLDASAFAFEKNKNGTLDFYKRNTDIPISMVDRTLVQLYEKPIAHIQSLQENVMNAIPVGWRFGMEYFIDEKPQTISYDRVPKNNLVLSYIHIKNNFGKLVRTVQDEEDLNKWADLLEIERSPIIFQGKLDNDQKIKIMEFLDTPFEELVKKFKTNSFVKFVVSVLNPKLKKTALNKDLTHSIEGLVFRFGYDDDVVLAKLIDPVFEVSQQAKAHNKQEDAPNEIYQLTVIDAMNFIESLNFNKLKPKGRSSEERYLNFICAVFNKFVEEHGSKYLDLNFNEPAYMKKKEFDLNMDMIPNGQTTAYITENPAFKSLFKIFLATFRKKKKRANGMLTNEVIKQFNGTVEKVHNHLSYEIVTENEIPTFGEFLTIKGRNIEAEEEEQSEQEMQDFLAFKNSLDALELDKDTEVADVPADEKPKKIKSGRKVNIIVGRFQPFHNGHLSMAKDLFDMNGFPCVVVVVHPGHNKSGNSPFQVSTIKTVLNNLPEETEGLVKDYCFIKRGFIYDAIEKVRELGYEPILWGAGKDRIEDYKKQLELNFKKNNELKLSDNFQLVQTDRYGSGTEVRKALSDDSFGKFKGLVPKSVLGAYNLLRTDIENAKREAEMRSKEQ